MKIQNVMPQTSYPQFKSNPYLNNATKVIANTKVSKNLTPLDQSSFNVYMLARKFRLPIVDEELKNLFKSNGEDFLIKAFDFLKKKLNIDKEFAPVIIKSEAINPETWLYLPKNNIIVMPDNIEKFSNMQIVSMLRHELRHYEQNMIMLRDDEIGEKLPAIFAKAIVKEMEDTAFAAFKDSSFEEICKNNSLAPDDKEFYRIWDSFMKNEDLDGLIKFLDLLENMYKKEWIEHREKLLKTYGPLPPNEKKKAQAYYKDFFSIDYYNKDGSINIAKHATTGIEFEANLASGYVANQMFDKECYFKKIKNNALQFLKAETDEMRKLRDETFEIYKKKQNNK